MERQALFLKSVLQEANQHKRQELLRMADADQINVISDYVAQTPCSEPTRQGQTRAFGETTTRHHDGSNRRHPLV